MDWKKLFSFNGENEKESTQYKKSPKTGSKNVETRITYQYPKAEAYDLDIKRSEVPRSSRVNKNNSFEEDTYKLLEKNRKRRLANNLHDVEEQEELDFNLQRENIQKSRSKSKQPFRPTDIPSPIYGLTRKIKEKKEPIEFELSEVQNEDLSETIADSLETVGNVLQVSTESPQLEIVLNEDSENRRESENPPFEWLDNHFIPEDNQNTITLQGEQDVDEHITLEEVAVTTEDTTTNQSEHEQITEPGLVESPQIEESKPQRKTIPFNVMMLKKDREFIERKSNVQTDSKIPEATVEINTGNYQFPSRDLLKTPVGQTSNKEWLHSQAEILNRTLKSFNVGANVVSVSEGPTVTRFEISPELGVKVNKITNLTDDLKLSLAARDIRIEAPIPGKHTIGIEVPNKKTRPVYLREIIDKETFNQADSPLSVALGLDISGNPIWTDLKKMPHGLIAGATGSGKSVCINTFLISLIFKARPDQVKLLLIDPKVVELAPYNNIPHLISPVITDVKAATAALKWAVTEMERRYELFAAAGVRDISKFNEKDTSGKHYLPYIVIVIDELADLMMVAPADVEEAIARIAQKARACGIHLLIATQRPSVDVITGLIKANVPTRIAFSVSSQIDSRTIIDMSGAERLLGKGDMLFLDNGTSKPVRLQGPFISDEEIEKVVEHVCSQGKPQYLFEQEELMKKADFDEKDDLLLEACEFAVQQGNISTSSLQRHFRIGYNRAARLIDMMEEKGMITESRGSKPRDVLITIQELEQLTDQML